LAEKLASDTSKVKIFYLHSNLIVTIYDHCGMLPIKSESS